MTRRRTRGFTMLEIMLVVSLLSFALGVASLLIAGSFRMHQRANERKDLNHALAQLALHLRQDAHRATSAELLTLDNGRSTVRLSQDDGSTIVFEASPGQVERRIEADAGNVLARDAFRFLPATQIAISQKPDSEDASTPRQIVIELSPQMTSPDFSEQPLRIVAAVGLLASPADAEEATP